MPNSDAGAHKVLLKKGEFVDASRGGRIVPFKIYYPDGLEEKVPVIIWSHGFGGNRDGAAFISRHLASHGYVIVHVTHDGTDSSLWEGKPGHPWDILRDAKISRDVTLARFHDVPFALDQLSLWAADNPAPGAIMDFDRLGMSGHSFGAMTTQVMAGMRFPDEVGELVRLREKRFKAGILYSPVPIGHLVEGREDEIYGGISLPLLHMTGTEDDSPLHDFGYEFRRVVYEHSGHGERYMHVLEGGDHMVYNGTRGKLGANDLRELHEAEIKRVVLAFWNAQLKGDASAAELLAGLHV